MENLKERADGTVGQKKLMRRLIGYTKDRNPALRAAAYTALGRVPAEESVDCLIKGLEDEHEGVREAAGKALGGLVQFCCVYGYQNV